MDPRRDPFESHDTAGVGHAKSPQVPRTERRGWGELDAHSLRGAAAQAVGDGDLDRPQPRLVHAFERLT